jgi:hypothetical protein
MTKKIAHIKPLRSAIAVLAATWLLLAGCVTSQFRVAAEDHFIQTATILRWCKTNHYAAPCDPLLVEDLEAMKAQAQHIVEVTKVSERD